jgi:hypothetical protein
VVQPAAAAARFHPDELCIYWGNLPRDSHVTFYLPQIDVDDVLRYASQRLGPGHLKKTGQHTLRCQVADVSFIPIPGPLSNTIACLMSIQLPPNLTKGQRFELVVRQVDGRTFRVVGTFQFTIDVRAAEEILPRLVRNLSVLKHIALSIPQDNRWYPVFERYVTELGDRARAMGEDPDEIAPSPTGSGRREDEPRPGPPEAPPSARHGYMGKVYSILYDRFGDFEGFILETSSGHRLFRECEPAVEEVVQDVCLMRRTITVYVDAEDRILRIVVHCC